MYDLAEAGGRETTAAGVAAGVAVEIDVEQEDPPETVGPEGLDLGETVVQQLAVAIDPYPRVAGAEIGRVKWPADAEPEIRKVSPFQELEALKGRKYTRERIRQIEAKALQKLRFPHRTKKLKTFLEEP